MQYIFETPRLRVRRFEAKDAERLFRIHQDEEVKKWIPNESYGDLSEAREAAEFFAGCVNDNTLPYVVAAELKETGALIGDVGINQVEGKPEETEIGFVICREYRECGYATELVGAMTGFVVSVLHKSTVWGRVMKGNGASARVLEKNGYRFIHEESEAEDDPYGNGMLVFMKTS